MWAGKPSDTSSVVAEILINVHVHVLFSSPLFVGDCQVIVGLYNCKNKTDCEAFNDLGRGGARAVARVAQAPLEWEWSPHVRTHPEWSMS